MNFIANNWFAQNLVLKKKVFIQFYFQDDCPDCKEKCGIACQHSKCTKKCYIKCNRIPCSENCGLKLNCGHICQGFCGEICPQEACGICKPAVFDKDKRWIFTVYIFQNLKSLSLCTKDLDFLTFLHSTCNNCLFSFLTRLSLRSPLSSNR